MDKKMSKGVSLFGSIEIAFGLVGSLVFFIMVFAYISSLFDKSGNPEVSIGMDLAKAFMKALWPSFLLFFAGKGALKLKSWAWYMNVYAIPLSLIGVYCYLFFLWAGGFDIRYIKDWDYPLLFLIPILIFIIFEVWFFTRPKVKEQFKNSD